MYHEWVFNVFTAYIIKFVGILYTLHFITFSLNRLYVAKEFQIKSEYCIRYSKSQFSCKKRLKEYNCLNNKNKHFFDLLYWHAHACSDFNDMCKTCNNHTLMLEFIFNQFSNQPRTQDTDFNKQILLDIFLRNKCNSSRY